MTIDAATLEDADWSSLEGEEVLFMRRLAVVGMSALEEVRHAIDNAVDGWNAQADATAVRFSTRAEMLACLLRDLTARRSHWYWRPWLGLFALPPGCAIARLLTDYPLYWPAIVVAFDRRHALADLWRALEPDDARELLAAITLATGWQLTPERQCNASARPPRRAPTLPTKPDWLLSAAAIEAARARPDTPLLRLAIVSWLWRCAPRSLVGAGAACEIDEIGRTMLRQAGELLPDKHGPEPKKRDPL